MVDCSSGIINLGEVSGIEALEVFERILWNATMTKDSHERLQHFTLVSGKAVIGLGLPADVLQLIPIQAVENSPITDDPPESFTDKLTGSISGIFNFVADGVKLVVGGLIAAGKFVVDVFKAIIDWGLGAFGDVISAVKEAVKKALSFVIKIIAEITKVVMVIILNSIFRPLDLLDLSFGLSRSGNTININFVDHSMSFTISIINQYAETWDLFLPYLNIDIILTLPDEDLKMGMNFGLLNQWDNQIDLDLNVIIQTHSQFIEKSNMIGIDQLVYLSFDQVMLQNLTVLYTVFLASLSIGSTAKKHSISILSLVAILFHQISIITGIINYDLDGPIDLNTLSWLT